LLIHEGKSFQKKTNHKGKKWCKRERERERINKWIALMKAERRTREKRLKKI
jgi:hypothetical protein